MFKPAFAAPGIVLGDEENAGVGGIGPHGDAPAAIDPLGLCQLCPTGAGGAARRPGALTTSSSSASKAAEPSTFGLGERRLGEAPPEPEPDADVESPFTVVVGRAIGAIGRVIGPGSAAADIRREGTEALCAIIGDEIGLAIPTFGGGPIGAAGANPRPNPDSKGGAPPNPRGSAEGPREGAGI